MTRESNYGLALLLAMSYVYMGAGVPVVPDAHHKATHSSLRSPLIQEIDADGSMLHSADIRGMHEEWDTQSVHQTVNLHLLQRDWRPDQIPNPWTNPKECNLPAPGWLCDPDGILSESGRENIMDVMAAIRQKTNLTCPDGRNHGYQAAAAVIDKMNPHSWVDGSKGKTAEHFATEIGNRWGVGDKGCGNGVMFFMSIDDRYAYIKTAKAARGKLSDSVAASIIDNIKPALRSENYDRAVLSAFTQIYNALQGNLPQKPSWTIGGVLFIGFFVCIICCMFGPFIRMFVVGLLMCLLMPIAMCLDGIFRARRDRRKAKQRQDLDAQEEFRRVHSEMQRSEFDQTMCPICLERLDAENTTTKDLECRHRFHEDCIDHWLNDGHASCPMCRQDVSMPLAKEDEAGSEEYQRRLRSYLALMQHRRPELFNDSRPAYVYDDTGIFFPMFVYDNPFFFDSYIGDDRTEYVSMASSLQGQFDNAMSGARTWAEASRSAGSSGGDDGGFSFGGGDFDGGGGGGDGW